MGSRAPDETDPTRMTREPFAGLADTNLIPPAIAEYRYNTDTSRPTIRTISRIGSERQTALGTIQWMVVFTESVQDVSTDDFRYMVSDNSLSATPITSVTGSGTTYMVMADLSSATNTLMDRAVHLLSGTSVTITDTNGNSNAYEPRVLRQQAVF